MGSPETVSVFGPGNLQGTIDTGTWPLDSSRAEILFRFKGRASMLVPLEALTRQDDGSYHLTLGSLACERCGADGGLSESPLVLPVIAEALEVHASPVETGRVRICKMVHAREETVDPPLLRDEVVIERVPINRVVEAPLSAGSEEDTLVVPLFEEVPVVEKRLLLKEEVHITTRRIETHVPQSATLRREEATVERINPEGDDNNPSTDIEHP